MIFTLNVGVSVTAVALARPGVFKSWVPWVVATLDAGVLLGVMIFGDFAERVSASYTPALAVSWAMFPLLALTAMRFKPALVLSRSMACAGMLRDAPNEKSLKLLI